jgi:excisionase family DNA binding protein
MAPSRIDSVDAIRHLLRLWRVEKRLDPELRGEVASVREFLEDELGPTVSSRQAARLLGVSHTALDRWLHKGEIPAVLTPGGNYGIPISELVRLLDEVEQARSEGSTRVLASVIGDRRRRAEEVVDVDRLLPRRGRRSHREAELQSLAYHRLLAERLDDQIVGEAQRRLKRWILGGRIDPRWADDWERILAKPAPEIAKIISRDRPRERELRQTSPFAGVLTEQERRLLVQAVEERALA